MIVEIRLPEISENVDAGDVVKVLVGAGDRVEVDQSLIELETEKAVFEVPSTAAGVISEVPVKPGDSVKVGDVIARVDTEAGAAVTAKETAKQPAAGTKTAQDSSASGGAKPAPAARPPVRPEPVEDDADAGTEKLRGAVVAVAQEQGAPVPASPTVRRLARELGIEIHRVGGSGPGGRITSEDVHKFAKSIISGAASSTSTPASPARSLPDFARFGEFERTPMSKVRQLTSHNLAAAWNTIPHVTQHDEADITSLDAARQRYAARVEAAGGKLTMTSILVKVCASALKKFPDFNASIDAGRNEIIHKRYVNIGIAVDTDRGLLVPVVRDADRKNIAQLSADVTQLADKARHKKIMPDEMEGGNFTISNLGGIGGVGFTPIVNWPEVAILGVSRASMKPVYVAGDRFEPRLVLPLSLSYDHRLIDGAAAARFLRWV
ncbi:MAG TPA: 2-oxo acid dehydrogenase subunit E2, partial [Candidatus Krumholzibacteria bacterium]|nr:2-oxo acid dehydrogenase subunit E2 [Candidatus Krumholzibacteria bacterium]